MGWVGAGGGVEDDDWEGWWEDFAPCGEAGAEAVRVFGEGGVAGFEGGGVEEGDGLAGGGEGSQGGGC